MLSENMKKILQENITEESAVEDAFDMIQELIIALELVKQALIEIPEGTKKEDMRSVMMEIMNCE